MPAIDYAIGLLARSGLAGIILFLLPPTGERPPRWQIGLAFLGWIGWCYWRGVMARRDLSLATIESLPCLWLTLIWTQLFVSAAAQ